MLVRKFDSIPMAKKLPITIVFFSVVVALISAGLAFADQRRLALREAESRLSQVTHAHLETIEIWLDSVGDELVTQGASPHTSDAMTAFSESFGGFPDPLTALQGLYITDNPNPTGSKHLLDAADDGSTYSASHAEFHGFFRDVLERYGYYDIFLISPEGDIVYTVFKELDYATNLVSGDYADSGLAEAFRLGRDLSSGDVAFVDYAPYAPSAGAPAAFLSTPIFDRSGVFVGVLAYQLPSERLLALVSNAEGLGETGETFLFGDDLQSRAGSRLATVAEVLEPLPELPQLVDDASATMVSVTGLAGNSVLSVSGNINVFGTTWRAVTEVEMAEILAPVNAALTRIAAQILICALVVTFLANRLSRTVNIPLQKVRDGVDRIAKGDYDLRLRATDRGDEIGFIASTLMKLCERLKASDEMEAAAREEQEAQAAVVEAISGSLGALARGDLDCQITDPFPPDYERLRSDFNKTVAELTRTIRTVTEHAERIRAGAGEIAGASDDLASRTENQAATLEETAAAIDELTQSVKAAADGAREVETIVSDAKSYAEDSGEVVQSAVSTMSQIEESSGQIVQIIGVIDDIAFQTNLLALNAGVEAARAGEAGRGFAVVASEVRALAQRSSEAAKEIKTLISNSNSQVEDGAALVAKAGEALTSIVERVTHISGLVSEIAQGAGEQAVSLGEVNVGVTSLDQVTQQNAAMVQENTTTAHDLDSESDALVSAVRHFRAANGGSDWAAADGASTAA